MAGEPSTPALAERLDNLGVTLSEGYRTELSLAPEAWLTEAFAAIERGYLLLVDYGHEAEAYYDESRRAGTLRCYSGHTLGMNPYFGMGRQDICAHVEFTSVRSAVTAAGFAAAGEMSQAEWLRSLGIDGYRAEIAERSGLSRIERMAKPTRDGRAGGRRGDGWVQGVGVRQGCTDGRGARSEPAGVRACAPRGSEAYAVRGRSTPVSGCCAL